MPSADWLDALRIDDKASGVRLVGMCRGMITLTKTPDDRHTLWLYDYPMQTGPAHILRPAYGRLVLNPQTARLYYGTATS